MATEELSSTYENVSIETWADNIHQIKVRELQELINKKKEEFNVYTELVKTSNSENIITAFDGLHVGLQLLNLQYKLEILKTHCRK